MRRWCEKIFIQVKNKRFDNNYSKNKLHHWPRSNMYFFRGRITTWDIFFLLDHKLCVFLEVWNFHHFFMILLLWFVSRSVLGCRGRQSLIQIIIKNFIFWFNVLIQSIRFLYLIRKEGYFLLWIEAESFLDFILFLWVNHFHFIRIILNLILKLTFQVFFFIREYIRFNKRHFFDSFFGIEVLLIISLVCLINGHFLQLLVWSSLFVVEVT